MALRRRRLRYPAVSQSVMLLGDPAMFAAGTTIGGGVTIDFEPVTAQRIRLHVRDAIEGPTIWDFEPRA